MKFLKKISCYFIGGFMLMFLAAGVSVALKKPDHGANVIVVLVFLSLLGLPAFIAAKHKNFHISGFKLWFYVTFIPVVSWLDIFLTSSQKNNEQKKINHEIDFLHSLKTNQPADFTNSYLKDYQRRWEFWEMEHDKPEQRKRWQKALIDCSLVKIMDEKEGIALISGSRGGQYVTTLSMCNCPDFAKRHKPCKHMYYWANYLGVFDIYSI